MQAVIFDPEALISALSGLLEGNSDGGGFNIAELLGKIMGSSVPDPIVPQFSLIIEDFPVCLLSKH